MLGTWVWPRTVIGRPIRCIAWLDHEFEVGQKWKRKEKRKVVNFVSENMKMIGGWKRSFQGGTAGIT